MARLVVLIILIAAAFWIYKEFQHARRRKAFLDTRDSPGRRMLPPHQRVGDAALEERVQELRSAVARGDVTPDEATGSLIRYAGGGMTPQRARKLIEQ